MTVSRRDEPPIDLAAFAECLILGGMAAMLATKVWRGTVMFYIHPRFTWLVVIAAVVLAALAVRRMRGIFQGPAALPAGRVMSSVALASAVILGTAVPVRPLGAATFDPADMRLRGRDSALTVADGRTAEWNLAQWAVVANRDDADALAASPVDVTGFVVRDTRLTEQHFVVARYVVACCTADGTGVGLIVRWPAAASLAPDTWVRVRGTIVAEQLDGGREPVIAADDVRVIAAPANPYLSPP
jgi:uncharacterized repeat protein (TIGR03943 family)